jgi:uncharacterized membrane protein
VEFTKRQRYFCFGLILFSGLFFCLVVPPFQTPDEFNHNFKIHHIAEGHFLAEIDTPSVSLGGIVPKSLVTTSRFYENIAFSANKAPWDTLKQLTQIPLKSDEKVFVAFPNTARYAFSSYLATIPVMYLANLLDINPLYTLYIGRVINFLFWFGCVVLGYRIMPIFKDFYLLLCMIPGTISIHASLSADTVNNGFLFLIIALFFDFKFSIRPISHFKLGIYLILTLIVAWNKIVYFPMLFMLFMVPKEHFGSSLQRIRYLSLLLVSVIGIVLLWNNFIDKLIYPSNDAHITTYHSLRESEGDNNGYINVNPRLQVEHIKKEPMVFFLVFLPAIFELYSYNYATYVSTVGWEAKGIPSGLLAVFIIFFLLYVISLPRVFSVYEKLFFLMLAYFISALFLLSQYLHWDGVGEKMTLGYLGKYFIAIYPLLFFALSGLYNISEKWKIKRLNLGFILAIIILITHIDMFILTIERYYL